MNGHDPKLQLLARAGESLGVTGATPIGLLPARETGLTSLPPDKLEEALFGHLPLSKLSRGPIVIFRYSDELGADLIAIAWGPDSPCLISEITIAGLGLKQSKREADRQMRRYIKHTLGYTLLEPGLTY